MHGKMRKKERRALILSEVEEQLKLDEPKEARLTLQRLVVEGYTLLEAKEKIAAVLIEEMYYVLKYSLPFSEEQYVTNLKLLK
jgi:hypothetical protein